MAEILFNIIYLLECDSSAIEVSKNIAPPMNFNLSKEIKSGKNCVRPLPRLTNLNLVPFNE